jgi:hypothetical protein
MSDPAVEELAREYRGKIKVEQVNRAAPTDSLVDLNKRAL